MRKPGRPCLPHCNKNPRGPYSLVTSSHQTPTVDQKLSWAYIDELPKRPRDFLSLGGAGPASYPAISPMFRNAALGTSVDLTRNPASLNPTGEPPHPDALAIESAIGRLRAAAEGFGHEDLALDAGIEGFGLDVAKAWSDALATLVTTVIAKAKLRARPPIAPAERPVCSEKVGPNGKSLVVRLVERPQPVWQGLPERIEHENAERAAAGLPPIEPRPPVMVEFEERSKPKRAGSYEAGSYCKLEWEPSPGSILLERAHYAAWRVAMDWLQTELTEAGIAVDPCRAARRPWLGEQDVREIQVDVREDLAAKGKQQDAMAHLRHKSVRQHYGTRTRVNTRLAA